MIKAKGLGGDVGQLMVSLFGLLHILSWQFLWPRPDCGLPWLSCPIKTGPCHRTSSNLSKHASYT